MSPLDRLLGSLEALLGPDGTLLGRSWGPLGASWGGLGPSWAPLGASWGALGVSWAPLGRLLGPSWKVSVFWPPTWVPKGTQNPSKIPKKLKKIDAKKALVLKHVFFFIFFSMDFVASTPCILEPNLAMKPKTSIL